MRPRPPLALALVLLFVAAAFAQNQPPPAPRPTDVPVQTFGHTPPLPAPPPATQPAPSTPAAPAEPSAEDVLQQLLMQRPASPVIAPSASSAPPAEQDLQLQPHILGFAPEQTQPPLYREGEFIVARRGRMLRVPSGLWIFQFESDSQAAPEPPLLLMPCQLLENMEELTRQRGDRLVFLLSGQVFTYHGRNWLLPSMMKLDVDRGNLQK